MDKKFYVSPEMEELETEIKTFLQTQSGGSPEFGGEAGEDDF